MSSLGWIDFDVAERERAQRIIALFREQDSRDELGLGPIRDSIADHLFPGTSTIQTRPRYMLFVPWLYRRLEGRDATPERLAEEARALEVRLIEALLAGGESNGVIGSEAGAGLKRLPSDIYWAGLRSWGIRRFPGSREDYFAAAPRLARARVEEEGEAAVPAPWNPTLPEAPEGLLETATFRLTAEEAGYLVDRIVQNCGESLLAVLARAGDTAACSHVWEHPGRADFPAGLRDLVSHAELFSAAMLGAALLYNLMLAEAREREDWVAAYRAGLEEWRAGLDRAAIARWSLAGFWAAVRHEAHAIRPAAERFVTGWVGLVIDTNADVAETEAARRLVREREMRLKGGQSRFRNRAALARWGGKSGAERLNFRWPVAMRHLGDLARAA